MVVIETIAPRATNAANTASLMRVFAWRVAMFVRWLILRYRLYKTEANQELCNYGQLYP